MSDSIAALHQQAVAMLQSSGAPMTAENLNRAVYAITSGDLATPQMDASAEPAAPAATGRGGRGTTVSGRTPPQAIPTPPIEPTAVPATADVQNAQPVTASDMPMEQVTARDPTTMEAFYSPTGREAIAANSPFDPAMILGFSGGGINAMRAPGMVTGMQRPGFTMQGGEAPVNVPGPRQLPAPAQGQVPQAAAAAVDDAAMAAQPGTAVAVRPPPLEGYVIPRGGQQQLPAPQQRQLPGRSDGAERSGLRRRIADRNRGRENN